MAKAGGSVSDSKLSSLNIDQAVVDQIDILKDLILETIPVEQIYLFGSYAYGTPASDSDLDMYVIMKDDASLPEIEAEQKIALAFIGKKTMSADVLVSKKSRFEHRLTAPTLEREVATKGMLLYG
jgi:predicted nucleotidyltransferase